MVKVESAGIVGRLDWARLESSVKTSSFPVIVLVSMIAACVSAGIKRGENPMMERVINLRLDPQRDM